MNAIENIYYSIVKTRLHVAAIYYFLCIQIIESTTHQSAKPFLPVIIAFTIWHYALYLFDRAYDAHLDSLNNNKESLKGKYRNTLLYFSISIVFIPILILIHYKKPIIPYLFFIPITFLYNLRIFPNNKAIKHFTFLKNFYSAILIWPLPIAVMVKYYAGMNNYLIEIMYWYWSFIVFVFMGEVIWDMRDVDGDRQENINTIPVVYGLKKTRIFLFTVLVSVSIINILMHNSFNYIVVTFYVIYILIASPNLPKWLFHLPLFISLFYYCNKYL